MSIVIAVAVYLACAVAYFAPAIVARRRRVTNAGSVFVVDLLLGWTVVGWIVALAMALRTSTLPPDGKRNGVGQWGRDIIDGIRG
jgi:Superinfection immunity protein